MGRVLVTGPPGAGKSTLARRVASELAARGEQVSGFVTQEIRRGGRRTGFVVVGLSSELERRLAVEGGDGPRVGRYGVDVDAFEGVALAELESGLELGAVLVVDEIGRMELLSPGFVELLTTVLSSDRVLATVHAHRHPVTDPLKRREDVRLVRLGPRNRDALVEPVTAWVLEQPSR